MTQTRLEFRTAVLIGLLALAMLYAFAGWKDFWKHSEGRVATVARGMIESGDYLVPRLGGYPRFEKPPLMYWAVAEVSRLFGGGRVTEWTATLPSALAGALAAMMVAAVATRFFGRATGLTATAILATSYGFYWWGHIAEMEMLFAAMITLAVGSFILWAEEQVSTSRQSQRLGWLFAAYAFTAAAGLTKGPVGLLIIAMGCVSYAVVRRLAGWPIAHLATRWHALGFAIFLAIALPWPAKVLAQPDAKEVFLREAFGRLGSSWVRHTGGPFFYFNSLARLVGPWIIAVPLVLWRFYRCWGALRRQQAAAVFLAAWFLAVFGFFTAVHTKQDHYLLPILPAGAMLAAWGVSGWRWANLTARIVAAIAAIGLLAYGGVLAPNANLKRSPRAFANEVRQRVGSQTGALALYFYYDQSPTADLRAALFFYLGPDVRAIGVPASQAPKTAAEFARRIGDVRFVVVSAKHWPPSWADGESGLKLLHTGEVDGGKFHLLTRTAP
jgi:4-amino-4-deoxy-L-arabinose transferase-like glycosyltransferase